MVITVITKPMLAVDCEEKENLTFPKIATPKIDGIRCLRPDARVLCRSFLPVPNNYIRTTLERLLPVGADGELFSSKNFCKVTSDVMTEAGEPEFTFCMFDFVPNIGLGLNVPYIDRLKHMDEWYANASDEIKKFVFVLPWTIINSLEELNAYEDKALAEGHEGVILRSPNSPYKCGRSTLKEGYMLKVKKFVDSEAVVLGFEEQMTNTNEKEKDEFGLTKRSSKKAGLVPAGTLGKFNCRDCNPNSKFYNVEFNCGGGKGLTKELRQHIWDNKDQYIGKIFKYKYQLHGSKDAPRIATWQGWRDPRDMDAKE